MSYNYENNNYSGYNNAGNGNPNPYYNQGQYANPYEGQNPYANPYASPYAQNPAYQANAYAPAQTRIQSVMNQVYLWMTGGLLVTGAVSVFAVQTGLIESILSMPVFIVLLLVELGLVWGISASINKIAPSTATGLFILYAALNGLTLSIIFLIYTAYSIASTFFITAGMFALMSAYGYTTKRDLTTVGNIAIMALIGIILASIVNLFLHSTGLYWIITYLGVLIFVGLTAWDTQRIKRMVAAAPASQDLTQRIAIIGALNLYLDFINLFLYLLRIFGRRR